MSLEPIPSDRRIYVNRTINLRSIKAIGYDMDYTLVHYFVGEWESRAFAHAKEKLLELGYPAEDIRFDPTKVIRGLAIDLEEGNLVKATRFGYVIRAAHGTSFLSYDDVRKTYAGTLVDLAEDRFEFMNTLFSLSEASLFAQLVDLMDAGRIERGEGYRGLYQAVIKSLDGAHREGSLKQDILDAPDRFIDPDPAGVLALVDQFHAGNGKGCCTGVGGLLGDSGALEFGFFARFYRLPGVCIWPGAVSGQCQPSATKCPSGAGTCLGSL